MISPRGTHLCLAIVLLLTSCTDSTPPTAVNSPGYDDDLIGSVLTEAAAAKLRGGRFVAPQSERPGTISSDAARRFAEVWLQQFGPYVRRALEQQHGQNIAIAELTPSPRVLMAKSPYDNIRSDLPQAIRNVLSDYYLVVFERANVPVVVVGVSAASQLAVQDGRIVYPQRYGNEFRVSGIPINKSVMTLTPEHAAIAAARASGDLVHGEPQLMSRGPHYHPLLGFWRVPMQNGSSLLVDSNGQILPDGAFSHEDAEQFRMRAESRQSRSKTSSLLLNVANSARRNP